MGDLSLHEWMLNWLSYAGSAYTQDYYGSIWYRITFYIEKKTVSNMAMLLNDNK